MQDVEFNSRIWIEKNGKPFLGRGRVMLLEQIKETGSINKAAKSLGMSYKKAWQLVSAINEVSDEPVVIRNTGGAGGGGTSLTAQGIKIIEEFNRIDQLCKDMLKEEEKNCCL